MFIWLVMALIALLIALFVLPPGPWLLIVWLIVAIPAGLWLRAWVYENRR